ncbi:ABC transporter permease [Clostridium vincentii]|uniref:ABC transporter permease YtrF n=1 Tax=Clostridium vincentii TaxID=52704 RepID=A0A2T0BL62_9CLOT|nr:ABC transporter permease [Clostridium vincentii]PRR84634.1 ABC transporter permease YtrF precursor [Clostridium vincentii]
MKLSDKIKIAFSDLMNRKGRSILTIIAVSIGSLLLIIMMGLGDGIINKMRDMVSSFGDTNLISVMPIDASKSPDAMGGLTVMETTEAPQGVSEVTPEKEVEDFTKKISMEDAQKIGNMDGVEKIRMSIQGKATSLRIENGEYVDRNVSINGVSLKYDYDYTEKLVAGKSIENGDNDILVGENLAKRLGVESNEDLIGKKITVKVEYPAMDGMIIKDPKEVEGTIVGVLDRKEYTDTIVMSDTKANPIAGYFSEDENYIESNGYSGLSVYGEEETDIGALSNKIKADYGYQTFSLSMISDMLDMLGLVVKSILSIAGIIVLLVATLGLVNTVTMIIQEKRKMIGVMRSVGGSKSHIRIIFIFQSIMLGTAGGVLGAVLSSGGILFINEFITKKNNFVISLTASNVGIAVGITVIISILAGLIPASKAARLNVVEAVAEE